MERAKKIRSFDNWKATVVWLATVLSIMIILFLAIESKSMMALKAVQVNVLEVPNQKAIISENIILEKLNTYLGFDVEAANIQDLNLVEIEHFIKTDDRIKSVEVFLDGGEKVHIEIVQRKPLIRVMTNNVNYYIDEEGKQIGKIHGIAIRVPIVTGELSAYNELFLTEEYDGTLKEVFELALMLRDDNFLSALIEQIHVNELYEMVLIPKLGDEDLVFGSIENANEKLNNIKDFYVHGMPKSGWNKFHTLTFKYKGKDGEGILFAEK